MKHSILLLSFLFCLNVFSQDFYDLNTIQTIEITFAQSNWDQLLDAEKQGNENYIMAQSVTINGTVFDSVGVKYKGNSTYNANQIKNPFHIELDTYKDHEYDGYTDIKLSNVAKDPSFLREVLSYQILRQYADAPLSNYANVYVNGNLIGLYSNSESISKKFVDKRFFSKKNAFVKCNPPDGAGPQSSSFPNLVYLGEDSTNYYDAYEIKSDGGWDELIDLCDTLDNHLANIEDILDVDRALWMLAFNNVLVNLDSYIGAFAQNYYLYRDDYGRFIPIVWDLNESFGRFSMTGSGNLNSNAAKQQMSHLLNQNDGDFPLVQKLLSIPMYERMYLAHFKTILLENIDDGSYETTALALQNLIAADVQADNNKFFTYNNFIDNLNSDIGGGGGPGGGSTIGITNLMDARSNYLLGLNDFTATEPIISNVASSITNPVLGQNFHINANIANENDVYIGYRSSIAAPFTRVLMFDDGAHNDGAANDGEYGIELSMSSSMIQYYIYAENNDIGMFSPRRAEYEYHTVTSVVPQVVLGDLVINEFMADNDSIQADSAAEFDDWIEFYNNGSSSINMEGYFLSDDANQLLKWAFPAGTTINADDYLIVWADNDEEQTGLHANFKLSASAETIFLSDPAGNFVDLIEYQNQGQDVSFARYPNGTGDFQTMIPTYNAENVLISDNDNDGVPDAIDQCPGFDDNLDADMDGIPDDCDYVQVELTGLLEGALIAGTNQMRTDLSNSNLIPEDQPYNEAPYNNLEAISNPNPPANVVDWILVEARFGDPTSGSLNLQETHAAFLLGDGSVVSSTGSGPVIFRNLTDNVDYYFTLRHRNHLDIISEIPLSTANGLVVYDFTTSNAYGTEQQKTFSYNGGMINAMYAGDFNQDQVIQNTDYDKWKSNPAGLNIYDPVDGNLDGTIQVTDFDKWTLNKSKNGINLF